MEIWTWFVDLIRFKSIKNWWWGGYEKAEEFQGSENTLYNIIMMDIPH